MKDFLWGGWCGMLGYITGTLTFLAAGGKLGVDANSWLLRWLS